MFTTNICYKSSPKSNAARNVEPKATLRVPTPLKEVSATGGAQVPSAFGKRVEVGDVQHKNKKGKTWEKIMKKTIHEVGKCPTYVFKNMGLHFFQK